MQGKTNIEETPREGFDSKLQAFELFKTFRTFDRAASVTVQLPSNLYRYKRNKSSKMYQKATKAL